MRFLRLAQQLFFNKLPSPPPAPSSTELTVFCDSTNALALRTSTAVQRVVASDNLSPATGNVPTWNGTKWTMATPGGGGALSIVKTANESRTNDASYTNDSELFFNVDADSTYQISILVLLEGEDMNYKITYPEEVGVLGLMDSIAYGGSNLDEDGAPPIENLAFGDRIDVMIRTGPAPDGAGVFAVAWGQAVSGGAPTTMLAGSAITYQKLENA